MSSYTEIGGGIAVLARSIEIAATPEAPATARSWLDGLTALRPLGQVAFDVRLLVTELVANSVRHAGLEAGDAISVRLELDDVRLRVEVGDAGRGFDLVSDRREPDAEGGRGLLILDAIAHRWGTTTAPGSTVWFEIDLERSAGLPVRHDSTAHARGTPAR
jgi:anti-sigma regulatory factor (Ser/Thr protein kinase)